MDYAGIFTVPGLAASSFLSFCWTIHGRRARKDVPLGRTGDAHARPPEEPAADLAVRAVRGADVRAPPPLPIRPDHRRQLGHPRTTARRDPVRPGRLVEHIFRARGHRLRLELPAEAPGEGRVGRPVRAA